MCNTNTRKLLGYLKPSVETRSSKVKVHRLMPVAELAKMPEDEAGDTKADTVLSRKLKKVSLQSLSAILFRLFIINLLLGS